MKIINQITRVFIFIIIIFGIIELVFDIKEPYKSMQLLLISATLVQIVFIKNKNLAVKIPIIYIVLVSSIGFSNFILDSFNKPITYCVDCEGHHAMQMNFAKGFIYGPILTIIVCYGYLLKNTINTKIDKIFAGIALIVLLLTVLKNDKILKLEKEINQVSKPTIVLPKGCK